jgi:SAM-dependent methyltransferase
VRAADWDARYAAEELWPIEPNVYVADIVPDLAPGRALDVACGEGRNAIWLAQQGWDVTAVDFSHVAVDRARTRATRAGVALSFAVADVLEFEMAPAAFDLVLLCFLQLPDYERRPVWARAATAVAPGGTLLVIGHDVRNVTDGFGGPRDVAVCYTAGDITAALGPRLRIESAGEILRPKEGGTAIDCLVRATAAPNRPAVRAS